jgi:hypothetical protein
MKLAKTLAMVACTSLLTAGTASFARHAYAQDANGQGSGSWRTLDASSADEATSPDAKAPPLDVNGCWLGGVSDNNDGDEGTIEFEFDQDEAKPTKIDNTSTIEFSFPDDANLDGPLKGTVTAKGIKFKGKLPGCSYSGTATESPLAAGPAIAGGVLEFALSGKIKFSGRCAKGFKGMTFEVDPGCAP